MPERIRFITAVCFLAIMSWTGVSAQYSNTYYYMYMVPQANQLNPAFQPDCKSYVGLPVVSPLRFEVESNSLRYKDIFTWDDNTGKFITFMHPDGDKQKFLNALEPVNVVRAGLASTLISVGWREEEFFFTLDFSERIDESMSFSQDFAEFMINGNKNQERFNFSDLANNINYYHELALGVSYNFDDEFQLGARAKLLLGIGNVSVRQSDINMKTSIDEWHIKSDIFVDASLPYVDLPIDEDGYLDIDSLQSLGDLDQMDLIFGIPTGLPDLISPTGLSTVFGIKNPGFALDFGFNYRPVEKVIVSASVLDLGFIRWRNSVYNFHQKMDYTFEGVEFTLEDDWDPGEGLLDSLESVTKIKTTQNAYTSFLSGRVYLGGAYELTEKVRFAGLFRTRIQNYKFYNQFTISANYQPFNMLSGTLSYSIYGSSFMNLGLGLSVRGGPFNFYFITDQAPTVYFWPQEFSSLNFRLGFNLVFGCDPSGGKKDRPLID
ncbi:MAG: hypothetical protein KAT31_00240 [Bacteroidales bacterium]|nr:hypothetical protein [Bacteroidales bacterium]